MISVRWACMGLPKREALRETHSLQVADTTNTRPSHYNYKSPQRLKARPLETHIVQEWISALTIKSGAFLIAILTLMSDKTENIGLRWLNLEIFLSRGLFSESNQGILNIGRFWLSLTSKLWLFLIRSLFWWRNKSWEKEREKAEFVTSGFPQREQLFWHEKHSIWSYSKIVL